MREVRLEEIFSPVFLRHALDQIDNCKDFDEFALKLELGNINSAFVKLLNSINSEYKNANLKASRILFNITNHETIFIKPTIKNWINDNSLSNVETITWLYVFINYEVVIQRPGLNQRMSFFRDFIDTTFATPIIKNWMIKDN
jgi:hypothetical protein